MMKFNRKLLSITSILFVSGWSSFGALSVPIDIPRNVDSGAIVNIDKQRGLQDVNKLKKKPKENIIENKEEDIPESGDQSKESKIILKKINVEDDTLLSPFMVEKVTSKYINREIGFTDLQDLTRELTTLYRDKGYVTSRVYLPPQKIKDGILTLQSSEGIIKPITIEEGKFFKSRAIFPRLRVDQYDKLNIEKIKKDLARLNENPDMGVQANLKPGAETGETELRLQVKDRNPFHVTPSFDNLGRRLIGEQRVGLGVTHNNLLGFGDRDTASFNWSRSSFGLSNGYEIPVGKYGTKLGFNYAHSRLKLGKEFAPLNVRGFATVYSPYITQELYRGKHVQASADLAFDFKNLGTDILGEKFSRDRLRVLRPGLNIDEFDKYGRTFIRNEFGIGLDILDASNKYRVLSSRPGSGPSFFRYTGFLTRVTQLPFGIQDVTRVMGQYSPNLLNSAEQLQVGGAFTVRGYKEGQFIGDGGYVFSNEVRVPFYIFPKSMKFAMTRGGIPKVFAPNSKEPTYDYVFRDNFQLVGFTDFGGAFTNPDRTPRFATPATRNYAFGTGLGVRIRLTRFLTARFDLGIPVIQDTRPGIKHHDLTAHFGLSSEPF